MHEFTGILMKDEEYIERLNRDGLNREGTTRPTLVAMLGQELSPTREGRSAVCALLEKQPIAAEGSGFRRPNLLKTRKWLCERRQGTESLKRSPICHL